MPLPAKRVDMVRVPNDTTTYDIVPSSLQDGSGKHSIATPTTTKDTTLVVGVKINNVTKEPTNGIVDLGTFQDGLDGDQLAAVNSGITADGVAKYEGYETKINSNTSEIGIIKDALKSGVTFKGKITDPTLPAATDYNNGDLIIFGEKEYICFDNGTSKEWIELGDEGAHLTKAMADTYYVEKNEGITGATKCKITYDAKGLVTKGENLAASDIPSLDAGKVTTGKFADERIASAATWNAKQDAITSGNKLDASLVSGLSTVATSGNYDDLSNKPAVENLVPYTGAKKNIDIGTQSFTMSSVFTVGSESSVYTQTTPGSIALKNPVGTLSIGISSLGVNGTTIYWPTVSANPNGKYFALRSDIPDLRYEEIGTSIVDPAPPTSEWNFLSVVASKTFSKAFTEVKPGSSGIPSGNATVDVVVTTYASVLNRGYKTIVDVTCRCEQFDLKDVGFNVLLSKVGSRWFMPRMAVSKGNMVSTAFNTMMDKLNTQKNRVGILVDEVAVFRDTTTHLGSLNVSGVVNGQVTYDYAEFRVFAVMLELDKDNEGKAIPCTGAHYRIVLYHPETIL